MPAPTIDGLAVTGQHSGAGSCVTAGLTTTNANDIIVIVSTVEGNAVATPNVTGVTGGGLAFALRARATNPPAENKATTEVWWALAASALSAVAFTVSYASSYDNSAAVAYAVSGCNASAPWDSNASLPKVFTPDAIVAPTFTGISTTSANDLILMSLGTNSSVSSFTEAPGFTATGNILNGGGTLYAWAHASRMAVTTQQTNATYTTGTVVSAPACICDALTADGGSGGGGLAQARAMVLAGKL